MTEILFVAQQDADGGFIASAHGHAIFTQADSQAELEDAVRDAVRCHFEPAERPTLIRLHLVQDFVLAA